MLEGRLKPLYSIKCLSAQSCQIQKMSQKLQTLWKLFQETLLIFTNGFKQKLCTKSYNSEIEDNNETHNFFSFNQKHLDLNTLS